MGSLDSVSLVILLGSLLVLAGILSSLIAMRFGAPLLLVFLLVGVLAGENGPGGIKFDDVGVAYTVGSIALALILFDGGLRTRFATFRNVLAPAVTLATVGVLITAILTAPVAKYVLGLNWIEALLIGAVVASTDAAAVFFLINARGLRLRPRVRAVLEVESGTNDPFAIFLALLLVEILLVGNQSWSHALITFLRDAILGCIMGFLGGRIIAFVINRLTLAQGLHAPFVAVSALVIFAFANVSALVRFSRRLSRGAGRRQHADTGTQFRDRLSRRHYLAGADRDVCSARSAGLAGSSRLQLLRCHCGGCCTYADRQASRRVPVPRAVQVSTAGDGVHFLGRPARRGGHFSGVDPDAGGIAGRHAVFRCRLCRGLLSLLVQGWTVALAARKLDMSFARADPSPRRVELDLPGQLTREIVGYPVPANSPFLRRGLIPNWARPTLVIRSGKF